MMVLASVATLAILGKATSALWPFEEQAKLKKVDVREKGLLSTKEKDSMTPAERASAEAQLKAKEAIP